MADYVNVGFNYAIMLDAVIKAVSSALNVEISSCVNKEMAHRIGIWSQLYMDKAPWVNCKKGIYSAGIPAAMSSELARLVTLEMQSVVTGADELNAIYQRVIGEIRIPVEYGCALGGVILKPYLDKRNQVVVQYIRADRFFPLSFDAFGNISQCVLMEQRLEGKETLTRLEIYMLEAAGLSIYNLAFRGASTNTLGTQVALTEITEWADILPEARFSGIDRLPFGYFKVPLANTADPDSPLGVSVFSRAVGLVEEADRRYSNLCWELEAKQAAIHIGSTMLKQNPDGAYEYPEGRERLYVALEYNVGATDKPLLDVYSPDIRMDALYRAYQEQLKLIEYSCGIAYGTVSDPQVVEKTAQEIRTSKQRLYATVTDMQKALQKALEDLVTAIQMLLHSGGTPSITFTWDDSILVDREMLQRQKLLEYNSQLIDAVQYHIDVNGMTEEAAIEFVKKMAARAKQLADDSTPVENEEEQLE